MDLLEASLKYNLKSLYFSLAKCHHLFWACLLACTFPTLKKKQFLLCFQHQMPHICYCCMKFEDINFRLYSLNQFSINK